MSEHLLSVSTREGVGRGQSRRLRAQGFIPAVIYGKSGNRSLAVAEKNFLMLMREVAGSTSVITLVDQDEKRVNALIHETQRDPLTDRFRHIDFLEVVAGEMISAHIPIHVIGEPYGVKNEGGTLDLVVHEVAVHCLPRNLPESIEVDVTELKAGEAIHLGSLPAPEGVSFDGDPDMVVVAVAQARVEEASTPAEAPEAEKAEA